MSRRATFNLLAAIVTVGAVLRIWGIAFGMPHTYARPDEEKILRAALGIFQGDFNPHLFLYPSLYIYLTAAAYEVVYAVQWLAGTTANAASFVRSATADPSALYLAGRAVTAATGIATIGALYFAAAELFSSRAALAASAFLSVAFLHVRDSHFGVTDVPVTLFVVCAFWAAARCATRGATLRRVVAAGLLCGLAASTKYNAVLVVVPVAIAIGTDAIRTGRLLSLNTVGAMAVLGVSALASFLAASPYIVLDYPAFAAGFSEQYRIFSGRQGGSIIGPARQVIGELGWKHYLAFSLPHGLSLPLLVTSLAGGCWLAARRFRDGLLVLSFPVLYYAAMGTGTLVLARNVVPLIPFLCLAAGVLVDRWAKMIGDRLGSRRASALSAAVLVVVVAAPTAAKSFALDRLLARTDTRVLAGQWLEARFPRGASVYQTGVFYGYLQPRPASAFPLCGFNADRGRFDRGGCASGKWPDVVVRLDSPLSVYSQVPDRLGAVLDAHYVLTQVFKARANRDGAPPPIYDQQDALYVPLSNLDGVTRPGPDVSLFVRRQP